MNQHVHPANRPLIELPREHPAHRLLLVHADCRRLCVGRETVWPGKEDEAFDQQWHSPSEDRPWRFSEFAYDYISFDLVLDGWLERPPTLTHFEEATLASLPRLRALIDECAAAAEQESNERVLELVSLVREWLDAQRDAITARIAEDKIPTDEPKRV